MCYFDFPILLCSLFGCRETLGSNLSRILNSKVKIPFVFRYSSSYQTEDLSFVYIQLIVTSPIFDKKFYMNFSVRIFQIVSFRLADMICVQLFDFNIGYASLLNCLKLLSVVCGAA